MKKRRLTEAQRERLFASRAPNEAISKEDWEALGYGPDGKRTRPLTDDPIGWKPRPRPESPT